jgi:hypothetical protein
MDSASGVTRPRGHAGRKARARLLVVLDLFESLFEVVDALEHDGIEHALVGGLALAVRTRARYESDTGRPLWVIGRDALIAMKVQAGRAQDLADVERLTELDR